MNTIETVKTAFLIEKTTTTNLINTCTCKQAVVIDNYYNIIFMDKK